jgi:uncharacterized membrane protein HdeD (DUF308 family)
MFAWRGAIALVFGVFVLVLPALTFFSLAVFVGLFAAVGGAIVVGAGLIYRNQDPHWWVSVLLGLASIGIGVVALLYPNPTAVVLLVVIAAQALAAGVLDTVLAVRLRRAMRGAWTLLAAGVIGIAFGVLAFWYLDPQAWLPILRATGLYATVTGVLHLAAAVLMKRQAGSRPAELPHSART